MPMTYPSVTRSFFPHTMTPFVVGRKASLRGSRRARWLADRKIFGGTASR